MDYFSIIANVIPNSSRWSGVFKRTLAPKRGRKGDGFTQSRLELHLMNVPDGLSVAGLKAQKHSVVIQCHNLHTGETFPLLICPQMGLHLTTETSDEALDPTGSHRLVFASDHREFEHDYGTRLA